MTDSMKWWVLAVVIICSLSVYLLAPILTPFVIAIILAYIGDPFVDRLETWRFSRTWAVISVFFLLTVVVTVMLLILVPLLEKQLTVLSQRIPVWVDTIQSLVLPWLHAQLQHLGVSFDLPTIKAAVREHWQSAGSFAGSTLRSLSISGLALLGWLANLVLIPVVTFYLLRDWDILVARIQEMLPKRGVGTISRLARESDVVLSAFLRGQLLVMLALSLIYALGLGIIGLDLAILIGLTSGVLSFVPYLGFIVGIVFAGVAALMQFQDATHLLYVLVVFGVGQAIEGTLLTPMLVGDRIGLHPVAVIFAVMAGGQLFGFIGVLLALPIAAVLAVLLRYAHGRYKDSTLYHTQG